MAFTILDLQQHYERMDTEELLIIAAKELTDIARPVLTDVLAQRGIGADAIMVARARIGHMQARKAEYLNGLATRGDRLLAFAIDLCGAPMLIYAVLMPLLAYDESACILANAIACILYFLFKDGIPGQSLGKRIMLIKTVRCDSGETVSFATSFWRNLSHGFIGVDALVALAEERRRFGDLLAKTQVVRDVKHGAFRQSAPM